MIPFDFVTTDIDLEAGELLPTTRAIHKSSVVDFFFGRIGQYQFGVIPPREHFNYFMLTGSCDGDFEWRRVIFEWPPCELSEAAYKEVVAAVSQLPGEPFERVEVPASVRTQAEFQHWVFCHRIGMPYEDDTNDASPAA